MNAHGRSRCMKYRNSIFVFNTFRKLKNLRKLEKKSLISIVLIVQIMYKIKTDDNLKLPGE